MVSHLGGGGGGGGGADAGNFDAGPLTETIEGA